MNAHASNARTPAKVHGRKEILRTPESNSSIPVASPRSSSVGMHHQLTGEKSGPTAAGMKVQGVKGETNAEALSAHSTLQQHSFSAAPPGLLQWARQGSVRLSRGVLSSIGLLVAQGEGVGSELRTPASRRLSPQPVRSTRAAASLLSVWSIAEPSSAVSSAASSHSEDSGGAAASGGSSGKRSAIYSVDVNRAEGITRAMTAVISFLFFVLQVALMPGAFLTLVRKNREMNTLDGDE